jgi:hypothetical protein
MYPNYSASHPRRLSSVTTVRIYNVAFSHRKTKEKEIGSIKIAFPFRTAVSVIKEYFTRCCSNVLLRHVAR